VVAECCDADVYTLRTGESKIRCPYGFCPGSTQCNEHLQWWCSQLNIDKDKDVPNICRTWQNTQQNLQKHCVNAAILHDKQHPMHTKCTNWCQTANADNLCDSLMHAYCDKYAPLAAGDSKCEQIDAQSSACLCACRNSQVRNTEAQGYGVHCVDADCADYGYKWAANRSACPDIVDCRIRYDLQAMNDVRMTNVVTNQKCTATNTNSDSTVNSNNTTQNNNNNNNNTTTNNQNNKILSIFSVVLIVVLIFVYAIA